MSVEVRIPPLGESITEGVISQWLKQDGDAVQVDEPILELETDKAAMEIGASAAGRLEIVAPQGSTVQVGAVVARITEGGDGRGAAAAKPAKPKDTPVREPGTKEPPAKDPPGGEPPVEEPPSDEPPVSEPPAREPPARGRDGEAAADPVTLAPSVRRLVAEHDLDPSTIRGSGKGGRITKEDVLRHLERSERPGAAGDAPAEAPAAAATTPAKTPEAPAPTAAREPQAGAAATPPPPSTSDVERVPMTLLRRRIAERLVQAQHTAAILTTFNEIDMSAVIDLRRRYKERFEKTHGVGLGFVSLFARAAILALREMPIVNAQIEGSDIVYLRAVNLGIAVATKRGLVVPVIRHAERMGLADLERAIQEVATLARDAKLTPDHLAGGTFSITNGGVFGSLLSTPILNPPQSAILGMHKTEERPVAIGGQVVIRPMMYVALSYDHRLIDGEQAVTFLVRVKDRIEDPARMLLEV